MKPTRRQPATRKHRIVAALLDAYLDGELAPAKADAVRAHLGVCAECERLARIATTARKSMRSLARTPVRPELTERILRAVRAEREGASEAEALARLRALPRPEPSEALHARILAAVAPEAERRQAVLCARFADRVEALLDGDLPEGAARSLVGHAERCPACARVLRQARAGREALSSVRRLAPTPQQRARVNAALEAESARPASRSMPAAAGLATCAILLAAALALPMLRAPRTAPSSTETELAGDRSSEGVSARRGTAAIASLTADAAKAGAEEIASASRAPDASVQTVSNPPARKARVNRQGPRRANAGSGARPITPETKPPKNGSVDEAPDRTPPPAVNQTAPPERAYASTAPELAPDQTGIGRVETMTLTL